MGRRAKARLELSRFSFLSDGPLSKGQFSFRTQFADATLKQDWFKLRKDSTAQNSRIGIILRECTINKVKLAAQSGHGNGGSLSGWNFQHFSGGATMNERQGHIHGCLDLMVTIPEIKQEIAHIADPGINGWRGHDDHFFFFFF
jgi:hypothetical protein